MSLTSIIAPYLSGNFIDQLIHQKSLKVIINYCTVLIVIFAFQLLLGYCSSILYIRMQMNMGFQFNRDVVNHVQDMPIAYIDNQDTTYLNKIINNDTNTIIIFSLTVFQNTLINIITIVIPLLIIWRMNQLITLALIVFVFLYVVLYCAMKGKVYRSNLRLSESQSRFFSKLQEQLSLLKFIKVHSIHNIIRERLNTDFAEVRKNAVKSQQISYIFSGLDSTIALATQIFIYAIGGILIINNLFTIGMFTIFYNYFQMMMSSVKFFFNLGKSYQDMLVSYNRLSAILNQKEDIQGDKKILSIESIHIRDVSFSYANKKILNNFNLELTKGIIYGITGVNGTGKSTLIDLMLGLYCENIQGDIIYNNLNIRQIDMSHLRHCKIGVSEQTPVLINGSIRYNLLLGKNDISDEAIMRQFELLNWDSLINSFPEKLDFVINEKNSNLSGGERQKLSIVRALLKDPDLLLFDEPTSALDLEGKKNYLSYIHTIKSKKIIVIVTHDKDVEIICDHIINVCMKSTKDGNSHVNA